jgi:uncharacterized protein GlcG (DUF336 family)
MAFDVLGGEYVRCVLASDGLWDVISIKSITKILNKNSLPEVAARALVEKAFKKRESKNLRLDDITVQVIDIHGNSCVVERVESASKLKSFLGSPLKAIEQTNCSLNMDSSQSEKADDNKVYSVEGTPINRGNGECCLS